VNPLRSLLADNPGPFTHEGTRTYILGHREVAIVDPGPDLSDHVRAVVRLVDTAERVTVVLTHGHGDHAGAVDSLMVALPQASVVGAGHRAARPLSHGDRVPTDVGDLEAIHTPGHTRDHLAFHWLEGRALFAGDMVLGVGDTTWVAEYPGCVADYLESLSRLEALPLERVHPAHGPDQSDPVALWRRYRSHREGRIVAVRRVLSREPGAGATAILERVYGDTVPAGLVGAAVASVAALAEYVRTHPGGSP
jgi:glyoxylase-like metal-dependent hydrolase (beta-lactamase superfamily II)